MDTMEVPPTSQSEQQPETSTKDTVVSSEPRGLKRPYVPPILVPELKRPKNAPLEVEVPPISEKCIALFEEIKEQPEYQAMQRSFFESFIIESSDEITFPEFELFTPYRVSDSADGVEVKVPKDNRITGQPNNPVFNPMKAFKVRYGLMEGMKLKHNNDCGRNLMNWMAKSKNNKVAVMEHRGGCAKESTNWHYHVLLQHDNEISTNCNMVKEATANKFAPWKLKKMVCKNPVQAMGYMAVPDPNRTYMGSTDKNMNTLIQMMGMEFQAMKEEALTIIYPQDTDTAQVKYDPYTGLPLDPSLDVAATAMVSNGFNQARSETTYSKKNYRNEKIAEEQEKMFEYLCTFKIPECTVEAVNKLLITKRVPRTDPNFHIHADIKRHFSDAMRLHRDPEVWEWYDEQVKGESAVQHLHQFKKPAINNKEFDSLLAIRRYWNEEYFRNEDPTVDAVVPDWVKQNVHVQATVLKAFGKQNSVRIYGTKDTGKTTIYNRGMVWPGRVTKVGWSLEKHAMANLRFAHHLTIIDEADFTVAPDNMGEVKKFLEGIGIEVEPKWMHVMDTWSCPTILIGQHAELNMSVLAQEDVDAIRVRMKNFKQAVHPDGSQYFWIIMNALIAHATEVVLSSEPDIELYHELLYEKVYQWLLDIINIDTVLLSFSNQEVSESYPEVGNRTKGYLEAIKFHRMYNETVAPSTSNSTS